MRAGTALRPRLIRRWVVQLALLCTFGCAGTETGNPPAADGTRDVAVLPGEAWQGPPYFDSEVLADAARLGMASMTFARVELLPEGTCGPLTANPAATVTGAVVLDLSEGMGFQLPAGRYCAVRLYPRLGSADDPDVPPLLVGHSLAFELRNLEGAPYVRVRSQRTAPYVLFAGAGADGVFEVPAGGAAAHLAVDAASALVALRFWESPVQQPDGSFVFEEANAAAFLRAFEAEPGLLRLFLELPAQVNGDAGVAAYDGGVAASDGGMGTPDPDAGVDMTPSYGLGTEVARTP